MRRNSFKHLSYEQRVQIQYYIQSTGRTISARAISLALSVSRSTVIREVRRNLWAREKYISGSPYYHCSKLDAFPFCCNGCSNLSCRNDQWFYDSDHADYTARLNLADSRRCDDKKKDNIKLINERIGEKVLSGMSIETALIDVSDTFPFPSASTIRRYCDRSMLIFKNIDLPRTVRVRVKKQYNYHRKSANVAVLFQRTHSNYVDYISSGKHNRIELDSVIGKSSDKYCALTIYEPKSHFQFYLRIRHTSDGVNSVLGRFIELERLFCHDLFDVILTDNGVEFQGLRSLEKDPKTGEELFKTFYCDPYRSDQKAGCERNHEFFRYISNKGKSIDGLSAEDYTLISSLINSYPRPSLGGQTPYDVFVKLFGDGLLKALGISKIPISNIDFKFLEKKSK